MWQARAAILPIILFCIGLNDKSLRGAERARLVEFCTLSVKIFARRALFPFRPTVGRWPCSCAFLRGEGWLCIAAGGRVGRVAGIRACGKRRRGKAAGWGLALAFARWCGRRMACGVVRDAPVRFFFDSRKRHVVWGRRDVWNAKTGETGMPHQARGRFRPFLPRGITFYFWEMRNL